MFMKCVLDRTYKKLSELIVKYAKPGTTLHIDYWKAYKDLEKEGYTHLTVNHSLHFVDPDTGVHTNLIESTWKDAKASLLRFGTTKNMYDSYFLEFALRRKYLDDLRPD